MTALSSKFSNVIKVAPNQVIYFVKIFCSLVTNILLENCPNTKFFLLRIQHECEKIRTRKNSVFGHFSRSVCVFKSLLYIFNILTKVISKRCCILDKSYKKLSILVQINFSVQRYEIGHNFSQYQNFSKTLLH